MEKHLLRRVVPNERSEMVLEFYGAEYRLFDTMILFRERGWTRMAYPHYRKRYSMSPDAICWPDQGALDAEYLFERSRPIDQATLQRQFFELGQKNQAPTARHKLHHVYAVYLAPFTPQPFSAVQNLIGGHAGYDEGQDYSAQELLQWPGWKSHFELSGCEWAIPVVESLSGEPERLIDTLIKEAGERLWAQSLLRR